MRELLPVAAFLPLLCPVSTLLMDRFVYWIALAIVSTLRVLPLGVCFGLGAVVGTVAWLILPGYRRLAKENLSKALGTDNPKFRPSLVTLRHFQRLGANICSSFRVAAMSEAEVRRCATVENIEAVTTALHRGKGVVLMISHIGNWELFAQANFHAAPYPTGTVYQSIRNRFIDDLINGDRRRKGVATFDRKRGLSKALTMLREGGLVAVLVDQHAGPSGIWTPLFNRLCSTSPLAASLAIGTGAAIIPMAVQTVGFAKWKIIAKAEIRVDSEDPALITARVNRVLEEQIRDSPEDWFWVHARWKVPWPDFLLAQSKRGVYLPDGCNPMSLQKFRILIRSSNWLGDAVMSAPAVRAIKAARPDTVVTILSPAKLADFWRAMPEVDDVIEIPAKSGVFRVAWKIRGKFDVAILFPNSARSALEVWLAGIPRRVGYEGHKRAWMLNQVVPEPKKSKKVQRPRHHAERYMRIAEKIGATPGELIFPSVPRPAGRIRLGVCPGAEYGGAKRWQPVRFRRMMQTVANQIDCEWTIVGVEKDRVLATEIAEDLRDVKCENLTGKTTLAQLIDVLRGLDVLVSNDTGTMHLAAALGVPVVAIFGSTEPQLTAPLGENQIIIRHQVECSPCFLRECPLDFRCMDSITAEEVTQAVLKLTSHKLSLAQI